jgi:uncharacterized beta-barrel protein YwiB (DUF1934 family)
VVQKTPVAIKLTTEIREHGNIEKIVVEESGSFIQKGTTSVLNFVEQNENNEAIHSLITIQPDKVSVKRSGAVDMYQVFKKKQKTENVYRHAYGTILMETHTDQLTYQQQQTKKGQLFISYQVTLNGKQTRRHRLTLTFEEEGQT